MAKIVAFETVELLMDWGGYKKGDIVTVDPLRAKVLRKIEPPRERKESPKVSQKATREFRALAPRSPEQEDSVES